MSILMVFILSADGIFANCYTPISYERNGIILLVRGGRCNYACKIVVCRFTREAIQIEIFEDVHSQEASAEVEEPLLIQVIHTGAYDF